MINSSSELKSLYNDVKETLKSIELVSIIAFIGILLKVIFPNKFFAILVIIDDDFLKITVNIIDLLFASFLFLAVISMILGIIFWILWIIYDTFCEKMNLYDEKRRNRLNILQRVFYGCDIRFLKLSQNVVVSFGLLFVLDDNRFEMYAVPLLNLFRNSNINSFELLLIIVFIVILFRVSIRLITAVFYKYLYLQPTILEDLEE